MKILIVGGAGYIGSHVTKSLLESTNHDVYVIDNLSTGHLDAVLTANFFNIDLANIVKLDAFFASHAIDVVMHLAASSVVSESVAYPEKYYKNNVGNTLNLLNCMLKYKVKKIIFSSSAAVYGDPGRVPINVMHEALPVNPYGRSKLMVEEILKDYAKTKGLQYIALRYFNVAGTDPEGQLGERHEPETHLIPRVLNALFNNTRSVQVYGNQHNTIDGTAVRDYVHVLDVCDAHLKSLDCISAQCSSGIYNVGMGFGYSVRQVLEIIKQVTKLDFLIDINPARVGDPASLVADISLTISELNWHPKFSLEQMVEDAWRYRQQLASACEQQLAI